MSECWPAGHQFALTLDLECDYGTVLDTNTYQALDKVSNLVAILESLDIPLTCFVQTEILDERPGVVETLQAAAVQVSFHPHSHQHRPRSETDIETEVTLATDRYREFFGVDPVGYRFPDGAINREDYAILSRLGYDFDASVSPAWRPGRFNNLHAATTPVYHEPTDLIELPFTVAPSVPPIPTSLSYTRLLGRPYWEFLCHKPPKTVVFNIHMHDLATVSRFQDLPTLYKLIYARNRNGFRLLTRVLEHFAHSEHRFVQLDAIHDRVRETH
jgi:peptidoglycan/xylan/chitin deacetylase (PgdA/CDA1 family)